MNEYKAVFNALKYVLFPKRCCFCGKVISPSTDECESCKNEVLRVEEPICYRCAVGKTRCNCQSKRNRYITAFAAPFYYSGAVKKGIHRLKNGGEKDLSKSFANEMEKFINRVYSGVKFDFVTFVPMTKKELSARGYNHVELLASCLADNLGLPCKKVLSKLYETKRQRELKEKYRSGNVLGAFDVFERETIKNKRILLCDDVLTTGSTLTECAKMLILNGAREVICITIAVGMPKKRR